MKSKKAKTWTHFLQLYLGLTPKAAHAEESGLPGLKSFFLDPYRKTVISRAVDVLACDTKAFC